MYYEIFERLCKEKSVTPSKVSKATGISTATLTSWKKGLYTPKQEKIKKIADYFNVPVDYLYNGTHTSPDPVQTSAPDAGVYYMNPETAKVAQAVFDDPDLRMLFDAAEDCAPDQIRLAAEMLKKFKEGN